MTTDGGIAPTDFVCFSSLLPPQLRPPAGGFFSTGANRASGFRDNMDSKLEPVATKRRPPNAGKGRVKGVPNKVTLAAKSAIAMAAEQLGGAERLVAWAKEDPANERAFWVSVYPKLLPVQTELTGQDGGPVRIDRIERVIVRGNAAD